MRRNNAIIMIVALLFVAGLTAVVVGSGGNKADKAAPSQSRANEHGSMEARDESKAAEPADASASSEAQATTKVDIEDYAFTPKTIKVKVGDTVTWTNQDSAQHDVVADQESEDAPSSQLLAKGESYSFTFKKAGSYNYHCSPHPYMKATVIVE